MKARFLIVIIVAIVIMGGVLSISNDMKRYSLLMLNETKAYSLNVSEYLDEVLSAVSNMKFVAFPSATSTMVKGYALMNLDGEVVYSFNMPDNLVGRNSDDYKYAILNGKYISPFSKSADGSPLIIISSRTSDDEHIAVVMVSIMKSRIANLFLVDKTGIGVNTNDMKWSNFLSVVALDKNGIILKNGMIFFLEPIGLGGYEVVMEKSFWHIVFKVLSTSLYIWSLVLFLLLLLVILVYRHTVKMTMPLVRFANFIRSLDTFKKWEKEPQNELTFKYNQLVEEHEKLDKDYSELIKNISETNVELVEMNKLLIEFSLLFNEIKAERKSLEEALRIAFRRMLDFSKPISGIGMKYRKMEIYLGTVNAFNFESGGDGKIVMELKTDSSKAKYVINIDRFTINERTEEMIRTLLYHITTFLSMYEFLEKSKNFMKYDPLTDLLTRQEFEELMKREEALAKRENKLLTFMMIDIKEMRAFNEKYGRLNGDVLLKFVAKVINENVRLTDIASRFGEDEFLVCFYGMKKEDGMRKCEQIVNQIHEFRYEVKVNHVILTYPLDGEDIPKLLSSLEKSLKNDEQ